MKNQSLLKNTLIILTISIIAKICSFLWEALLAAKLGASYQADALYMVLGVFNILFPILDAGIWKVFLPIYKQKMVKSSGSGADRFTNKIETLFLIFSLILVLFIIIFAKPLVYFIAPGFSTEMKTITIKYMILISPMYLFMSSASIIGAILQCHGKFLGSQIREVASHASKIVLFLICYKYLGIYSAILAYIIGSICRLAIQIPFIDWGYKFKPNFNFKNKKILQTIKALPSVSVTVAIEQINSLVDKMLASNAIEGSIACLNYGNKLVNVFSGMITTALATAVYPNIAEYVAEGNKKKIEEQLIKSMVLSIITIIPITVFCFLFSNELVTIAFQRGSFNYESTVLTSNIFKFYSIGMLFAGLTTIVTNVFYAYGDTKITFFISILNVILNVILNLILYNFIGIVGLALATSISTIICFFIRIKFLKRYIKIKFSYIIKKIIKILIISLVSCLIPYIIFNFYININPILKIILCMILTSLLYIVCAYLMKVQSLIIKQKYNKT